MILRYTSQPEATGGRLVLRRTCKASETYFPSPVPPSGGSMEGATPQQRKGGARLLAFGWLGTFEESDHPNTSKQAPPDSQLNKPSSSSEPEPP